jgi:hypothetical protein
MEATLRISLYSYLSQTSKILCVSYYFLCFLFSKFREHKGRTGSAWKLEGEEGRRRGRGTGGRNDQNNVCTCEYMNNKK